MTKNNILKILVITSSLLLLGIYVAYRSGMFEDKNSQSVPLKVAAVNDTDTSDNTEKDTTVISEYDVSDVDIETMINDSLRSALILMSSSKLIRVLEPKDVKAKISEYYLKEQESSNNLKSKIESLTKERNKLEASSSEYNSIVKNLDVLILRLTDSLKKSKTTVIDLNE